MNAYILLEERFLYTAQLSLHIIIIIILFEA